MIEEIRPELFRIQIPLPENPLKYLNSYVVRSPDKNLIIDTGLNRRECLSAMHTGLKEIGVSLEKTDIFITHLHADHFGLVSELVTPGTQVLFNRPDSEIMESLDGLEWIIAYAFRNGFPKDWMEAALAAHPASKFGSKWLPELKLLEDREQIHYGDYIFTCIETPGHTKGHICLFEQQKKLLISGDHLLIDITPNIICWIDEENPLKDYLQSLEKIFDLDIDLVLPGHRRLFKDHRSRIQELKAHHQRRLDEVLAILRCAPLCAYEIASRMSWDLKADSWEAFPIAQKLFATGEALSHIWYLERAGSIRQNAIDGILQFSLIA